jgi:hypothetical protein
LGLDNIQILHLQQLGIFEKICFYAADLNSGRLLELLALGRTLCGMAFRALGSTA